MKGIQSQIIGLSMRKKRGKLNLNCQCQSDKNGFQFKISVIKLPKNKTEVPNVNLINIKYF
jgi:hypothetical protein